MTTPAQHSLAPPAPWRRLALATTVALALHAVLLAGLPDLTLGAADPTTSPPPGAATLLVRQIGVARPAQSSPSHAAAAPPAAAAVAQPRATKRLRGAVAMPAAASDAAASGVELPLAAQAEGEAEAAAATPAVTAAASTEAPAATPASSPNLEAGATAASTPADASSATPLPQYRTHPAPAATLLFDMKRGLAGGQAVLQWRPDGINNSTTSTGPNTGGANSYSLTLQAQAFGISIAGWNSTGRFDAAGLAPDRYAESRRSREVRATHFQRAADKISFSAQATEYPLPPGVQDRSSWMLQLGAILQANPELAQPGAQVMLMVVGTRGAPEPWLFTVQSRTAISLGAGDATTLVADAVHLTREPRRPYDMRASVWLDPARHHLPVKMQMVVHATGEGHEFDLRQLTLP